MKGDFTRLTYDPARHFTKVLQQQGRAVLDADWNEQVDIAAHYDEVRIADVVGQTGFPKGDSFAVTPLANGDITVHAGRCYVDGLLGELPQDVVYSAQPDLPGAPVVDPAEQRRDLFYVDLWERHVAAVQDPSLKDAALGGADTATRVKTVCQIRVLRNVPAGVTCASALGDWLPLLDATSPLRTNAQLTTTLGDPGVQPDLCQPIPGSAFRGIENRLYRVEIHDGGGAHDATFKWSRDNGAVTFGIAEFRRGEPARVRLRQLGRDQLLTLTPSAHAEVVSEEDELRGRPGTLTEVDNVIESSRLVTFHHAVDAHAAERVPIVRRWESGPIPVDAGRVELEDGIFVELAGDRFATGDYWTFSTRTAVDGGIDPLLNAAPHGVKHHVATLAILTWHRDANQQWTAAVADCRPQFPPLTDIDATDVTFHSDVCGFPAAVKSVQGALEELCRRACDCCYLTATPGNGWESIFTKVPAGGAAICFPAGTYDVAGPAPVVVQRLDAHGQRVKGGHLEIVGSGASTLFRALRGECALLFNDWASVTVRDLSARSSRAGARQRNLDHLNGVLTFQNCDAVTVSSLRVQCAPAVQRSASCLTVINDFPLAPRRGFVDMENCELHVGDEQVGVLVVNSRRAAVTNNRIRVVDPLPAWSFDKKLVNKDTRRNTREMLVSNLRAEATAKRGTDLASALVAKAAAKSDDALTASVRLLIEKVPPKEGASPREVQAHVVNVVDQVLLGRFADVVPADIKRLLQTIRAERITVASQGITVAGRTADEVHIRGNTLSGVAQGIHVGVSHTDPARVTPYRAGRVVIADNVVHVVAAAGATRSRHAIFTGNCDSVLIVDNFADLARHAGFTGKKPPKVEAIRLFGYFGRYLLVRDNHVAAFTVGVTVEPRGVPVSAPMWRVTDNFTAGATLSVQSNPPVVKNGNAS